MAFWVKADCSWADKEFTRSCNVATSCSFSFKRARYIEAAARALFLALFGVEVWLEREGGWEGGLVAEVLPNDDEEPLLDAMEGALAEEPPSILDSMVEMK